MKEKKNLRAIQAQRFLRYSIRKFSVGVASVAIASGLAVLTGANVQAEEANATAPAPALVPAPVNTESTVKPNTEVATANVENKENKPVVEKVDKSSLDKAITRLEKALEKAVSTEKTASAIESAKAELASAKAVAANEAATKEEVAKATSAVNGNAFVVESMPKAPADKKEEKENKNQDSRNGQAIPGQGESGFREATANPIIPATEGPTNNNKLGSGNNPADGVFESAKNQFGDIDFANATEKIKKLKNNGQDLLLLKVEILKF